LEGLRVRGLKACPADQIGTALSTLHPALGTRHLALLNKKVEIFNKNTTT